MKGSNKPIEFSIRGYESLLTDFFDHGYKSCFFEDFDGSSGKLMLRHDIDFSLTAALEVARAEYKLGCQSYFYVLLQTEFYNLLSAQNLAALQEIRSLGHRVGLHFDASRYDQHEEAIEEGANYECNILELILGEPVNSISFHRPANSFIGSSKLIANRIHTYQPKFMKEIGYIADSRGLFRFGHPLENEAFLAGESIQLLTHPIWWPEIEEKNKMDLVRKLLSERADCLHNEAILNCKPYAEIYRNK